MGGVIELKCSISLLFHLNFKFCKYCNKPFYPQHNRQVHCKAEHRNWYRQERFIERRRKQRLRDPLIAFIDGHGNYNQMKSRNLDQIGSMKSSETFHRKKDFNEELKDIKKQKKSTGVKIKCPLNPVTQLDGTIIQINIGTKNS